MIPYAVHKSYESSDLKFVVVFWELIHVVWSTLDDLSRQKVTFPG